MTDENPKAAPDQPKPLAPVIISGVAIGLICGWLNSLSRAFADDTDQMSRPLLMALFALGVAFIVHLYALRSALKARDDRRLTTTIVVSGLLFRGLLLFSEPIQEIDIYRYIWDGAVSSQGISPFRYSPEQVQQATQADDLPTDLQRLVQLRETRPALATILDRIHFAHVTTVYPPVSQAVFRTAYQSTPPTADVATFVFVMKLWILGFDVGTFLLLIVLLRRWNWHRGWSIGYGWSPLVLKEFANSGHLDSIAVCFTVLAILCTLNACLRNTRTTVANVTLRSWGWGGLCAFSLAAAVGAKLFPVVLAPLTLCCFLRSWKLTQTVALASLCLLCGALMLRPMMNAQPPIASATPAVETETKIGMPPIPLPEKPPQPASADGLKTFAAYWEMNDWIFLILIENLRPTTVDEPVAWFVVTPEAWRVQYVERLASIFPVPADRIPFWTARIICLGLFLAIAGWLLKPILYEPLTSILILRTSFLTLAWFWLLLPTQNPWYWIWAMPFLPFARQKSWWLLGGLVLLYYLRFWLAAGWPVSDSTLLGYDGRQFFDLVVTWVEFLPWAVWLLWEFSKQHRDAPSCSANQAAKTAFSDSKLN